MDQLGGTLIMLGFVGFFWGILRKPGQKALWVVPSLLAMFIGPPLMPSFQAGLRESQAARSQPAQAAPESVRPTQPSLSEDLFMASCRSEIRERLAVPQSARFSNQPGPRALTQVGPNRYWLGIVEAKNILGTRMRANFQCAYFEEYRVEKVRLIALDAHRTLLKNP